jgi:hypothetical protein
MKGSIELRQLEPHDAESGIRLSSLNHSIVRQC